MVWSQYDQTGGLVERLGAQTDGWATVLRAPFESQGAEVREL